MSFWSKVGNAVVTGAKEVKQRNSDYTQEYSDYTDEQLYRTLAKSVKSNSFIQMNSIMNILKSRGYSQEDIKENVKYYK